MWSLIRLCYILIQSQVCDDSCLQEELDVARSNKILSHRDDKTEFTREDYSRFTTSVGTHVVVLEHTLNNVAHNQHFHYLAPFFTILLD